MNAVKSLFRDLVERRLWPVALLLVAAAVAVPVYFGRSSNDGATDSPAPAPQTAQVGAKASKAAVSLDETTDESDGAGKARNPFKQQHVPKTQTADAGSGSTDKGSAPSGSSSSGGASSGESSSGGAAPSTGGTDTSGPTPTAPAAPAPKSDVDVSHVTLHLGPIGTLKTYKDLARLSPLPSAGNPLFVFTGVLKDGKTAVLLPNSTVMISPESDVSCKPSNKSCQKLELEQDDTVFFTLAGDTSGVQYQLDVASVRMRSGGTTKATAASLQRHSSAGAAALRDAHVYGSSEYRGAADYRFDPETGLLTRVPEHGTGAAAASAGDAAAALPGLPVWHWRDAS
jgi:hypothetical protein